MERMTPLSNNTNSTSSTPATSISSPPEHRLDLFASKFVPSWLQNINSLPALRTIWSPSPPYINFDEYAQTFLAKPLYQTCVSSQFLAQIASRPYALDALPWGPQVSLQGLNIGNYSTHFRNALIEERRALAEEFKQYNLYNVQLEPSREQGFYQLSLPGLREYIPAVFVGDLLIVRAICTNAFSANAFFDGIEYFAYISGIDRSNVTSFRISH